MKPAFYFLIPDPCYPIYANCKHHIAGNNQKPDIFSFRKQEYDNRVCYKGLDSKYFLASQAIWSLLQLLSSTLVSLRQP